MQALGANSFDLVALCAVQNVVFFPLLLTSYWSESLGINLMVH